MALSTISEVLMALRPTKANQLSSISQATSGIIRPVHWRISYSLHSLLIRRTLPIVYCLSTEAFFSLENLHTCDLHGCGTTGGWSMFQDVALTSASYLPDHEKILYVIHDDNDVSTNIWHILTAPTRQPPSEVLARGNLMRCCPLRLAIQLSIRWRPPWSYSQIALAEVLRRIMNIHAAFLYNAYCVYATSRNALQNAWLRRFESHGILGWPLL